MFDEKTYYQRSMEMLDPVINNQLFRKDRPILTKAHDAAPAKYSSVVNSIIMQGVTIKSGARVENAIIDKNNVVPANTELRGTPDAILTVAKAPMA